MNEPKKHHFLPQFYLELFKLQPQRTRYPQIVVTSKEKNPRKYYAAIHDTGCIGDYHTIDFQGLPIDRRKIEQTLSQIESDQRELFGRIVSSKKIIDADKSKIAFLLTLMHMRVPKYKRNIEASLRMSVQSLVMLRRDKLPPIPQEIRNLGIDSFRAMCDIGISNWIILSYMYDSAIGSKLSEIIDKMTFSLLFPSEDGQFITGDTPVTIYHPNYDSIRPYGVGFLDKQIEVTFPLSPHLMLFASWNTDEIEMGVSQAQLKEYNRRTVIMADQYIYSQKEDDDITNLVSENASKEAGFKTDQIDTGEGMYTINRFIPVTK